jgi:transposase
MERQASNACRQKMMADVPVGSGATKLTVVRQHGAWANIPPKRNRTEALCFSPYLYPARNLVERFFNKHCRRVVTRYDKLAANDLAFVQLASIRLWLRINESMS